MAQPRALRDEQTVTARDGQRAKPATGVNTYAHMHQSPFTSRYEDLGSTGPADGSTADSAPVVFQGKFAFIDDGHDFAVGDLQAKSAGHYMKSQIEVRLGSNWQSDVCFRILCRTVTPPSYPGAKARNDIQHRFVFYLKEFKSDCERMPPSRGGDHRFAPLFDKHCSSDGKAVTLREQNLLDVVNIDFCLADVVTEGIKIDQESLPAHLHNTLTSLKAVFCDPSESKRVNLIAFCAYQKVNFVTQANEMLNQDEGRTPAEFVDAFFNVSPNHLRKVQKGQITPREERPRVKVPPGNVYMDMDQFVTINGVSVLHEEETLLAEHSKLAELEGIAHVFQTSAGSDREPMLTFHPHEEFTSRLQGHDYVGVKWEADGEEWPGFVLPQAFQFAAPGSTTIVCKRPRTDDRGWDTFQLKDTMDLAQHLSAQQITDFCLRGPTSPVWINLQHSEKPTKAKIRALRDINPAHAGELDYEPNYRFNRLMLGQDLRSSNPKVNVFHGIDVDTQLRNLQLFDTLNQSQRLALQYLQEMPGPLGVIRGAWGVGKTMVDCIVVILLLVTGDNIKVLSETNDSADHFTTELCDIIERLKKKGVKFETAGEIVRWHSPHTEDNAIMYENKKDLAPPADWKEFQTWQPDLMSKELEYDWIACEAINAAKERPYGISDRRYKLAEHSISRLLLRLYPVDLQRPSPAAAESSNQDNVDDRPPAVEPERPSLTAAEPSNQDVVNTAEPNAQNESGHRDIEEGADVDQQEIQDTLTAEFLFRQAQAVGEVITYAQFLGERFQDYFRQILMGLELDGKAKAYYKFIRTQLIRELLYSRVQVVVTTIVNSDNSLLRPWSARHTIVQESELVDEPTMIIALAQSRMAGTVHLSGDPEQLRPQRVDPYINDFATFTNGSLFRRLLALGYRHSFLNEQYRTIPLLGNIISDVWYEGKIITKAPQTRPNSNIVARVHGDLIAKGLDPNDTARRPQKFEQVKQPVLLLNVDSESKTIGHTKSKINIREAQLSVFLARNYVKAGVPAEDIVLLTGYQAQRQILCQLLFPEPTLTGIRISTIDGFLGQQASVVIMAFTGSDKLGFMAFHERLLVGFSRARDAFVAIGDFIGIGSSHERQSRKRLLTSIIARFRERNLYHTYSPPDDMQLPSVVDQGLAYIDNGEGAAAPTDIDNEALEGADAANEQQGKAAWDVRSSDSHPSPWED